MNYMSVMRGFTNPIKAHRVFKKVYRGSLELSASWKTDRGLHALLLSGIGLMMIVMCQQLIAIGTHATTAPLSRPPQNIADKTEINPEVPELQIKRSAGESLFRLAKQISVATTTKESNSSAPAESSDKKLATPARALKFWKIQIQCTERVDSEIQAQLSNARQYLQSGDVDSAIKLFKTILIHDPHQVEAMAEMLLIARKSGDTQEQTIYLERLRQEIPEYEPGNEMLYMDYQE